MKEFSPAEEMLSKESRESRSSIAVKSINANANATQKMKSQLKQEFLNVDEETLNDEDYVIDHGDLEMRVVKAHIGSKILTSIVQEKQTNIPLASDSNPVTVTATG